MSFGVAILALAFLVLVHEAGHFVVARAVGMRPRKFYLGFGPPLVKTVRGGVEYGIAALPLGGYVKIPGMHRPAAGDLAKSLTEEERAPVADDVAALDEAVGRGDFARARELYARLEPALRGNRFFQELEGGLAEDAYWRQRAWKRVVVIAAGPATNVLTAVVLFVVLFMLGTTVASRTVESVLPGHPAASAGLKPGDEILRVAGAPVTPDTIATHINATHGKPFTLVVSRGGRTLALGPLRARLDQGLYRVGFVIKAVSGPGDSFPHAVRSSFSVVGSVTSDTVKSIGGLFSGRGTHNVSSVVGITRATSQAYNQSLQDFIGVVGLISLALGLLNLLPVLPLDGGHI
ncbi:MAG: site-2 protease family protein, partial [Actinobacteria bacterium]|nr:site-2 protease family protein [Actinomycetota bacterium]